MRHVFWLRTGVIGGRSGPNRNVWNPQELADAGIGAVLSVNDGELVHPNELTQVGIKYHCVPLSDRAPPRPGDLEVCLEALPRALSFVLCNINAGRSILVHCNSGKDRTGLLLAYYLCATGRLSGNEAIREVRRVRPIALSADGWDSFALQILATLEPIDR